MIQNRPFASIQRINKELEDHNDLGKLLCNLENYAVTQLISNDKDDAQDMVQDLFDKLLSLKRKWYDGDEFNGMLFGAMKSMCDNANEKFDRKTLLMNSAISVSDVHVETEDFSTMDKSEYEAKKEWITTILKQRKPPPDELELSIFECWIEGYTKQQEVAELLGQEIKEIRKGVKRLKSKLPEVRILYKANGYEHR